MCFLWVLVGVCVGTLEELAGLGDVSALDRLGELAFIGDSETERNLTKAREYFVEGYRLNSTDSGFYLSLLSELAQLTGSPDVIENQEFMYHPDSVYGKAALISQYFQCRNSLSLPIPWFLHSAKAPPSDCGACEHYSKLALSLADKAVQHIQETSSTEYSFSIFSKEQPPLKDFKTVLPLYSRLIEETGSIEIYTRIAENYIIGNSELGISRNLTEAIFYLEKAAEQGDAKAIEHLGLIYAKGLGAEIDPSKAFEHLEKARGLGSVPALGGIGYMYLYGIGIPVNLEKAFVYYKQAADLGHGESMNNIGVFYSKGEGVQKNELLAVTYFEAAAAFGHLPALFNLGLAYYKGEGVPQSCISALLNFKQVYEKVLFVHWLSRGYEFYKDSDLTGTYLSHVVPAKLGILQAQLTVALLWEQKLVPFRCQMGNSYCAAVYYTQAGLSHKSEFAYLKLGDIVYSGFAGVESDYGEAYYFYSLSQKYPEALFAMGYMNEWGIGVAEDLASAEVLYLKAQNQSNSEEKYPTKAALYALHIRIYLREIPLLRALFHILS